MTLTREVHTGKGGWRSNKAKRTPKIYEKAIVKHDFIYIYIKYMIYILHIYMIYVYHMYICVYIQTICIYVCIPFSHAHI